MVRDNVGEAGDVWIAREISVWSLGVSKAD